MKTQMQLMKKFNEDFGHKFLKCIFEYAAKILPTCEESLRVKIEKMQDKVKGLWKDIKLIKTEKRTIKKQIE